MTFGLFSNATAQRCEFVRMKGPQGKGHAEMAVTKPKGSGVETPTSEPGFCVTDMWDSEWEVCIGKKKYCFYATDSFNLITFSFFFKLICVSQNDY